MIQPNSIFPGSFGVFQEHLHFSGSFLHLLSPWKMKNCNTITAIPTATLYQAIDLNWLMSNKAKMTAAPTVREHVHYLLINQY